MNVCKSCGTKFSGNFCPECGTKYSFSRVCGKCGEIVIGKFCTRCGLKYTEPEYLSGDSDLSDVTIAAGENSSIYGSAGLKFERVDYGCVLKGKDRCKDTNVVIPDEYDGRPVVSVGTSAFSDCTSIKSVVIPDHVTTIESSAFWNCKSLEKVTIADGLKFVCAYAFFNCISLKEIYYEGDADDWCKISIEAGNDSFLNAGIFFYSERKPVGFGHFWHYRDGAVIVWDRED